MATTKNITIKTDGSLNAEPITVVVVFEPKGAYSTFDPIVWQVASWQATGEQAMDDFTWTSEYAFSALSDPNVVDVPIKAGKKTSLQKNKAGYSWTDPQDNTGHPSNSPQAWNMTGWKTNIGYGFIVNKGSIQEEMETVIAYLDVGDKQSVDADFSPTMSVYIFETAKLPEEYQQGQRLASALDTTFRSWSKDLRTLDPTEVDMTLNVSYNPIKKKYVVAQVDAFGSSLLSTSCFGPVLGRVLNAKVAFDEFTSVPNALSLLQDELAERGYVVDVVSYGDVYYGEIQLELPRKESLSDAQHRLEHSLGHMGGTVVELSGRVLIQNNQIAGVYLDVNPVSFDWYSAAVSPFPTSSAAADPAAEEYQKFVKSILGEGDVPADASAVNGNGDATPTTNGNGDAAPAANGNGDVSAVMPSKIAPKRKATVDRPAVTEVFAAA